MSKRSRKPPRQRHIRVGTSGWNYRHWREIFYPKDLPMKKWFEFYAQHFDTVEINNSFYRQPPDSTYQAWHDQAPPRFLYAVKANRYLTHMRKLKDPRDPLDRFFSGARLLKSYLGPVLYQLPPGWKQNLDRLEEFFRLLPKRRLHVMEYRDASWLVEDTFALMRRHRVCLCIHDQIPRHPREITGQAFYVRFHGTQQIGSGKYTARHLERWAEWIDEATRHGKSEAYVYFNNDLGGHAITNAKQLREMLLR